MCADNRVNANHESTTTEPSDEAPERPRWWRRNPTAGVLATAALGIAAVLVTASIKPPDPAPGSTLVSIVILPIALLLPAIALAGAIVAWNAFQATHGRVRTLLAAPCAVAMILNTAAVVLFARWVSQVFFG